MLILCQQKTGMAGCKDIYSKVDCKLAYLLIFLSAMKRCLTEQKVTYINDAFTCTEQ